MRVRHRAEPSAFAGTERLDPTAQHLDEQHFRQSRERDPLAGTLERRLVRHALQNRLEPTAIRRRLQEKHGRK